jgi:1,4-dihydroxy-2-naphthoate octaprenyltransferase
VLAGSAAAAHDGEFRTVVFIVTLAAALLLQIGANLANDVFDFERGADAEDRLGPPRATQMGLLAPGEVRWGMFATFGGAALIGLYLAWVGGWPILAIGAASIVAAVVYTGGPWPIGYHGLGDVFVFAFFGLAAVCGTYLLHAGHVGAVAWATAVPVGLLITAILVVNNLRDLRSDARAGKRTLAVRIGDRATRAEYALLVGGAYVAAAAMAAAFTPWLLLALLSVPAAAVVAAPVLRGVEGRPLNVTLKRTAQLALLFGVLLSAGYLM